MLVLFFDALQKVLVRAVGLGIQEQIVIQPDLRVHARFGIDPVNRCALDLASVGRVAAARSRVILGVDLDDVPGFITLAARAANEVCALETALGSFGVKPLILGNRLRQEIVRFNPQVPRKGYGVGPLLGMDGVVFDLEGFALSFRVVRDDELHRAKNRHGALGGIVEVFSEAVLQKRIFHRIRRLCNADALAEVADGVARVAAAAQAAERRHARVVPAGNAPGLDQQAELALGHDGVVNAESGKLDLARLVIRNGNIADHPVIKRAMRLKFQRAQRVRNALERVLNRVSKVVHRIDAPLVALAVMVHVADAVDDRVSHPTPDIFCSASINPPFGLSLLYLIRF